jgi:hypothetical protein
MFERPLVNSIPWHQQWIGTPRLQMKNIATFTIRFIPHFTLLQYQPPHLSLRQLQFQRGDIGLREAESSIRAVETKLSGGGGSRLQEARQRGGPARAVVCAAALASAAALACAEARQHVRASFAGLCAPTHELLLEVTARVARRPNPYRNIAKYRVGGQLFGHLASL